MMIHDLLSVARQAPLAPSMIAGPNTAKPAPSPTSVAQDGQVSARSTIFVAGTDGGGQVALSTALAAYQEFAA